MQAHLDRFLKSAISLTEQIESVHRNEKIYEFINDKNVQREDGRYTLKDFAQISREIDLLYISPEQSGRIGRKLDFRTDFYSLGVLFYRILLNNYPFNYKEKIRLIHAHLNQIPKTPHDIDSAIPAPISDIIMKLLQKHPEDRYQSTKGLKDDLGECREQLAKGGVIRDFIIGKYDVPSSFSISKKFYGRKQELQVLDSVFKRIKSGNTESVIVSGAPGSGKTTLLERFFEGLSFENVYIGRGKYEKDKMHLPYHATIQSYRSIIKQILTETEEEIIIWRQRFLNALGVNARILCDFIPEFELIVQKQPDIPMLGARETEERFISVFINFLKVFADFSIPVVIFADDLQWSDSASFVLRKKLLEADELSNLMLIGTFRTSENNDKSNLGNFIENLEAVDIPLEHLVLKPVGIDDVYKMVKDTLHVDDQKCEELVDILQSKTDLNPFYVKQFLTQIYEENYINFVYERGWEWNLEELSAVQLSDNVAEYLADRIRMMDKATLHLLQLAAIDGFTFNTGILNGIISLSEEEVDAILDRYIEENFIVFLDNGRYRFLHDKIHEAVLLTLDSSRQKELHIQIARQYMKKSGQSNEYTNIFSIVGHYNQSLEHIQDDDERQKVIALNIAAAKRAKETTAYSQALKHITTVDTIVKLHNITLSDELIEDIEAERAENLFLIGDVKQSKELFKKLISESTDRVKKAEYYCKKCLLYTSRDMNVQAINAGKDGLKLLNISLPEKHYGLYALASFLRTRYILRKTTAEDFLKISYNTDSEIDVILKLYHSILVPAQMMNENLLGVYLAVKVVQITINKGMSVYFPLMYAMYGLMLGALLGKYKETVLIEQTALKLEQNNNESLTKHKTEHLFAETVCWGEHIKLGLINYKTAFQHSVERGDKVFIGFAISKYLFSLFISGASLKAVLSEYKNHDYYVSKYFEESIQVLLNNFIAMISNLHDNKDDKEKRSLASDNLYYVFLLFFQFQESFLNDDYAAASATQKDLHRYHKFLSGVIHYPEYFYYLSMNYYRMLKEQKKLFSFAIKRRLKKHVALFQKLADQCPDNFEHKYFHLQAEYYALQGKSDHAFNLFEKAIKSAEKYGYIQNAGLAAESAGILANSLKNTMIAVPFLLQARSYFKKWGSEKKVENIDKNYGALFNEYNYMHVDGVKNEDIDVDALISYSADISSEITLESLKEKTLQTLLAITGAQRGFIITRRNESLFLEGMAQFKGQQSNYSDEAIQLKQYMDIPHKIINYVDKTRELLLLDNAFESELFKNDPCISKNKIKSILCFPLIHENQLKGILYFENSIFESLFARDKVNLINYLATHISISLENAFLYEDLKQEMTQRSDLEKQLYHRQKLEAVGTLANGIAHDFNNILAIIMGYSELLLNKSDNPVIQKGLREIHKGTERGRNLVDGLLTFSRQRKTQDDETRADLRIVMKEVLNFIKPGIAKNIQVSERIFYSLPAEIIAEEEKLIQVLTNLCINACHAMEQKGGLLEIALDKKRKDDIPKKDNLPYDQYFCVSVKDTGAGIPQNIIDKIFEPYFTTKPVGKGTGLGLSICYGIVSKYDGFILVESKEGEGTIFSLYFPIKLKNNLKTEKRVENSEEVFFGSERLLIVDDEAQLLDLMEIRLRNLGYQVTIYERSTEALKEIQRNIKSYDLIISDQNMPEMTGEQLITELRKINENVPVLLMSGYGYDSIMENDTIGALKISGCISKPISFSDLQKQVRTVLDKNNEPVRKRSSL